MVGGADDHDDHVIDDLEAAQLARLEAAGAPARLPKHLRKLWLAHADVLEPSFGLIG